MQTAGEIELMNMLGIGEGQVMVGGECRVEMELRLRLLRELFLNLFET